MDAVIEHAKGQPKSEWDNDGGGANVVLHLVGAGASLPVCYPQAFSPDDNHILLEATDDLLQGRDAPRKKLFFAHLPRLKL